MKHGRGIIVINLLGQVIRDIGITFIINGIEYRRSGRMRGYSLFRITLCSAETNWAKRQVGNAVPPLLDTMAKRIIEILGF